MRRVGNHLSAAALACWMLGLHAAAATPPAQAPGHEVNPLRAGAVSLGPEASRILVGLRVTAQNAMIRKVSVRQRGRTYEVTLANTTPADAAAAASRAGVRIARSRQITPSMHVLYLPATLYGAGIEAALAHLRADPAVEFAVIDGRRHPLAVTPDDPLFEPTPDASPPASGQWYLGPANPALISLEGNSTTDLSPTDAVSAWSITTGSAGVVIADVDTGVRFEHPDLGRAGRGGRLLPGYDFVGEDYDPTTGAALGTFLIANDGDGWDPDPSDPGDWISSADLESPLFKSDSTAPSSWHGTRVVGVMGALGNNGVGIAGITWGPWILPVRALGKGGGYDSDIIAGIEWAVGLPLVDADGSAVPLNPYPADIVNLSLGGGTDACSSADGAAYKSALAKVTAMGVLVVVSAGNASGPVELPANCSAVVSGVLAVAGLRNVGTKVGYSSFGPEVSISAPAGNCVAAGGDCLRSIDSTTNLGSTTPAQNSYTNEANPNLGTSFSAPLVSGIAALMRSVNGNLTPAELIARLKASARPFPAGAAGLPTCPATDASSGECACPNDGSECGTGMADALQAVEAAQKPIVVIALPPSIAPGSVIDAGASVAGCNPLAAPPAPLGIASYAWTANPQSLIVSGANTSKVTIDPAPGTLTVTVTDTAGNASVATVALSTNAAHTSAPSSARAPQGACPTAVAVAPIAPVVRAAFAPESVSPHATSILTITLANSNPFALTQSSFALALPAGLALAGSPGPSTTCRSAALSLSSTASSVSLSDANIPPDGACTIALPVQAAAAGGYSVQVGAQALATGPAGGNTAGASASLTVNAPASGGGGAIDGWDMLLLVGALLVIRRRAPPPRGR